MEKDRNHIGIYGTDTALRQNAPAEKGAEKAVSVEDPAAGRRLLPDGAVLGQD